MTSIVRLKQVTANGYVSNVRSLRRFANFKKEAGYFSAKKITFLKPGKRNLEVESTQSRDVNGRTKVASGAEIPLRIIALKSQIFPKFRIDSFREHLILERK